MIVNVTRRHMLAGSAGLGFAAALGATSAGAAESTTLDLTNPSVLSDVYAKIYATTQEAEVHKY